MEAEILKTVSGQEPFAALFVVLLFYVLKHNERREERLMNCLEKLTEDVGEIKSDIVELKGKVGA